MSEKPEQPAVGSELVLPVVPSPSKTTIFPENSVVATAGPEILELIFLRHELFVASQTAVVAATEHGGMLNLEIRNSQVGSQLVDIGHVRLQLAGAVDLAFNILQHAAIQHNVELKDRIAVLTAGIRRAK